MLNTYTIVNKISILLIRGCFWIFSSPAIKINLDNLSKILRIRREGENLENASRFFCWSKN